MGATDVKTPHRRPRRAAGRASPWVLDLPRSARHRAPPSPDAHPAMLGRGDPAGSAPPPGSRRSSPGYQTAMFGKWHLGLAPGSRPQSTVGRVVRLHGPGAHRHHLLADPPTWGANRPLPAPPGAPAAVENGEGVYRDGEYFTDLIAQKVEFIRRAAQRGAVLPHHPMHAPRRDRFARLPWTGGDHVRHAQRRGRRGGCGAGRARAAGHRRACASTTRATTGPSREFVFA